ncbi:suppressor of fused domain protein [Corynebacterium sp. ES2794-CONJ1]|uniref:suppressor of fused domain protein n=1 Tax=unclassified Corynebacterium TaxID=2624378 RepID=UPI00216833E8|nr:MULTISPECIES: suppressor of fused domain protein [unclassified Corynebacterium]MCS4490354.1 suppressor of fused domain protein [Corynebacterium sp. ES2775-CONJ]MCS4492132.1 suppressor of fused domain protein [Corynebacterium sp. ES2715-CONJ3]MCS4532384.1 suppressor of fused domain protein [Corynebacterium sp. ES2730-CONJ]MCU9519653.1 suppressor of fused domain protein [Corynebacterium sp. ES2794-CONJ1]
MFNLDESIAWISQLFPTPLSYVTSDVTHLSLASGSMGEQHIVSTLDLHEHDQFLQADGRDIRCEIFSISVHQPTDMLPVVDAAAKLLLDSRGAIPAHPGTIVPGILNRPEFSVQHGLLISPSVWGEKVPMLHTGEVTTLMLQLILINSAELKIAKEEGIAALQQRMLHAGVNLLSWSR